MFGMSSTEFWEEEPQLYWAYRFSYEKSVEFQQKKEQEQMKFASWLQGKINEVSFAIALNNAFSKKKKEFPNFNEFFKEERQDEKIKNDLKEKLKGVTDKEERGIIEYNYWARI